MSETPSEVLIDIADFIDSLRRHASSEVLQEYLKRENLKLRYLNLAQMVASNTTREQNADWMMKLIEEMATYYSGEA